MDRPKRTFTQGAVDVLNGTNDFIKAVETLLVDTISAFMPWLTPFVPAYLTYYGAINYLHFPNYAAWILAIVVESLGLSAINTTFQFWDWNDAARGQRAPWKVALGSSAFYLIVVLAINVLMDMKAPVQELVTKALISSLSICGGIIIALRSQHNRRVQVVIDAEFKEEQEKEQRKLEAKQAREAKRAAQLAAPEMQHSQLQPQLSSKVSDWRRLSDTEKYALLALTPKQIGELYPDLSERACQLWRQRAKEQFGEVNGNGNHRTG